MTYTVEIVNDSVSTDPVEIQSLTDDVYGDLTLADNTTLALPVVIQPGDSYTGSFTGDVSGNAGYEITNVVTAAGVDDEDNPVSDDDDATVTVTDVQPVISVTKTANYELVPEGGDVTYTVEIVNDSVATDPVEIQSLTDNIYGDLDGKGDCVLPQTIQPGDSYTCSFTVTVSGSAGDEITDVVTATGVDDEGNPASDDDDATIIIYLLTASPETATNPITTDHTVLADINVDIEGVPVIFDVISGPNTGKGETIETSADGTASFTYTGDGGDGTDTIRVWIDQNGNGIFDEGDPSVDVTKNWVANFVTGGGHLNMDTIGGNGKKVALNFAGNVGFLSDNTIVGQFQIVDHTVDKGSESWHCNNDFSALVFGGDEAESPPSTYNTATFTGTFTSNRGNQMEATITISDLGEGKSGEIDTITYSFDGSGPFGPFPLDGGNFQVHQGYKGGDDEPAPVPGGGGGGGGGPDKSPPRISKVAASNITRSGVDITWTTHEKSTSKVEYSAGGQIFLVLNEDLVREHHIQLSALAPGTTYAYRTISVDKAGNEALSEEQVFTTLGMPATFTIGELEITPSEVTPMEDVTISAIVRNSGDAEGSYTVTLTIENEPVDSQELTLSGGAEEVVMFTVSRDIEATYAVDINNEKYGSFIVGPAIAPVAETLVMDRAALDVSEATAPNPVSSFLNNWWIAGCIAAGCLAIGWFVYLLVRRRRGTV